MNTLFSAQQAFRVIRLTEEDATRSTDPLRTLGEQLAFQEEMYPRIKTWFRDKVIPGLRDGSRVAYLGFEGEKPILTAVVKRGEHAKFCHLRIAEEFQDLHLGEVFFSIMALEVRTTGHPLHTSRKPLDSATRVLFKLWISGCDPYPYSIQAFRRRVANVRLILGCLASSTPAAAQVNQLLLDQRLCDEPEASPFG